MWRMAGGRAEIGAGYFFLLLRGRLYAVQRGRDCAEAGGVTGDIDIKVEGGVAHGKRAPYCLVFFASDAAQDAQTTAGTLSLCFRSQRHISLHSTETKCRRLQSALLVVRCILTAVSYNSVSTVRCGHSDRSTYWVPHWTMGRERLNLLI